MSVRFESGVGGRIVETHVDGTDHVWGTVEGWEPPQRTTFTWHPGGDPASATRVTITFSAEGDGTVVSLEHEGWDALGSDASNVRNSYHSGWDPVLSEFTGTWE